jgi:hypothetical protein
LKFIFHQTLATSLLHVAEQQGVLSRIHINIVSQDQEC